MFDPSRFLDRIAQKRRHFQVFDHPLMRDGFGTGPRRCLGATLAKLELNAFICSAVQQWRISSVGNYGVANHAATFPSPAPRLVFEPIL
jgi:cytochrome P450